MRVEGWVRVRRGDVHVGACSHAQSCSKAQDQDIHHQTHFIDSLESHEGPVCYITQALV